MTKAASRWWTYGWLLIAGLFLAEEIPAAVTEGDGTRTLSKHCWNRWFPTWAWWAVLALWGICLLMHLSPLHWPWYPVAALGAVIVARVLWVETRDWWKRRRA